MSKLQDVFRFHSKMGFWPFVPEENKTQELEDAVYEKRCRLIEEEAKELVEAIRSGDKVARLHESVDLVYVVLGGLLEHDISQASFDAAWKMVQEANMAKKPPADPLGKAEKGPRWKKAEVVKALSVKGEVRTFLVCFMGERPDGSQMYGNTYITIDEKLTDHKIEQIGKTIESSIDIKNLVILSMTVLES